MFGQGAMLRHARAEYGCDRGRVRHARARRGQRRARRVRAHGGAGHAGIVYV